jgi:lipoprotein-anchoring transpeptidase ErfK/SrfK
MFRSLAVLLSLIFTAPAFSATPLGQPHPSNPLPQVDTSRRLIISIRDQKLMLFENGGRVAIYPISTSKYGVGDFRGKMTTPLGNLVIAKKIGDNAPVGAVFHNRRWTGEILQPNAPGRDPVTTRIIWLSGLEAQNAQAFPRCIYIHGTPEEKNIGRPASYGCIRMKSSDIAVLYDQVPLGALVQIIPDKLPKLPKARPAPPSNVSIVQNQQQAIPQAISQQTSEAASASGTLSVEQMRMAGAVAAERQKAQGRKSAPVLNKGTVAAQTNPRA